MIRWQGINGIYQIYPRSFKDSNGDGIGDLSGVTEKLDYLKGGEHSLGIDAIWLSPFFRSPMADFGYDVADYYSVDPIFGDLEDFKTLVHEAHERGIKVMVDYVPNHTSEEHPWFVASRSSKENEKRHWYVWRDPKPDGSPPNNWLSVFGGSAWEFDEPTGQYYLHSFLSAQPDLNWDNPDVRKAMTDVLDFWLSLGVDGIRADAVRWISKDYTLPDNPPNPTFKNGEEDPYHAQLQKYTRYGEHLFAYLKEMTETVEKYQDRIILFEDYPDPTLDVFEQYDAFYNIDPNVSAPFNFEGLKTEYDSAKFREFVERFQRVVGSEKTPFYVFGNHDKPRLVSRVGREQARLVAMLQLTLPGIPVIYYGDELGMHDEKIPPEAVRDPFELQTPGLGLGRDPQRTPMQWNRELNAGFTDGEPWLPVPSSAAVHNVEKEYKDTDSFFHFYKSLLRLRHSHAIRDGSFQPWSGCNSSMFAFRRASEDEELLVLLNMSDEVKECDNVPLGTVLLSTHASLERESHKVRLLPHQGIVIRCEF